MIFDKTVSTTFEPRSYYPDPAMAVCPNCDTKNLAPGHNLVVTVPTARDKGDVAVCMNCETVVFEAEKNWRPRL